MQAPEGQRNSRTQIQTGGVYVSWGASEVNYTNYERTSVSSGMISVVQTASFASTDKLNWMRFNLCSKLDSTARRFAKNLLIRSN